MELKKICVIGLGYVGLPLAVEFGKKRPVVGFDINEGRIMELRLGLDSTLEVTKEEIKEAAQLKFTSSPSDLASCSIFIVTVPTPVDGSNSPDMSPLELASQLVGKYMPKNSLVIYESTVFPGATEEICVPILEKTSGKKYHIDFECGYSPERINPGDKKHRLVDIKKITSGGNLTSAMEVNELYGSIIKAGTYMAPSIKVAEAAKVIENTQRDLNIALMNELSLIFERLEIDTLEVLSAAETKWNFLPFRPGLVGGHCIGVDPYYLTHKSEQVGYHPEVILAGRRINDSMATHVANKTVKLMLSRGIEVLNSRVLLLGLTFKENCPDLRNSKVYDIINSLQKMKINVDVYDPWIDVNKFLNKNIGFNLLTEPPVGKYDGLVIAVPHSLFIEMGVEKIRNFGRENHILYDLKGIFPLGSTDARL